MADDDQVNGEGAGFAPVAVQRFETRQKSTAEVSFLTAVDQDQTGGGRIATMYKQTLAIRPESLKGENLVNAAVLGGAPG